MTQPRKSVWQRLVRNIAMLPTRTAQSIVRRSRPQYRLERASIRYARQQLAPEIFSRLCNVPGYTVSRKCMLLYYLAVTTLAPGCIVEIGAFKGKSTAWLAQAARQAGRRLHSIDPQVEGTLEDFRATVREFDLAAVTTIYHAFSHDVGKGWSAPIAFLWVDGGHDYGTVLQDIRDFAPHVTPGGWIVFDDARPDVTPGVIRAIEETLRRDDTFEYVGRIRDVDVFRRR